MKLFTYFLWITIVVFPLDRLRDQHDKKADLTDGMKERCREKDIFLNGMIWVGCGNRGYRTGNVHHIHRNLRFHPQNSSESFAHSCPRHKHPFTERIKKNGAGSQRLSVDPDLSVSPNQFPDLMYSIRV